MRYPSIVIPSEARNLCHLRSGGQYQGIQSEKPAYPQTFGHRHYLYSAALLIFMRRTTPVEPSEPIEPIEPAEPLSLAIKGRVAPGLTLKFESRDD